MKSLVLSIAAAACLIAQSTYRVENLREAASKIESPSVVEHLRARDGGRFVVAVAAAPDLPVKNAFRETNTGAPLAVSADAGLHWRPIEIPGIPRVNGIALGKKIPGLIYAWGSGSDFRASVSRDDGLTWDSLEPGLYSIVIDPRDERTIYRSTGSMSRDGGKTWQTLGEGIAGRAVRFIERPGANEIYAISDDGVAYRNEIPGGAWTVAWRLPGPVGDEQIEFDSYPSKSIYFRSGRGQLFRSDTGGASWKQLDAGGILHRIAADPARTGHLIARGEQSTLVSFDAGETWTLAEAPERFGDNGGVRFEFDSSNPNLVYADGRSYRSDDAGRSWRPQPVVRAGEKYLASGQIYNLGFRTADAYIEKWSAGGNLEWATYLGGDGNDLPKQASVGPDGSLWIGFGDWVARISPAGQLLATFQLGRTSNGIAVLNDGKVLLAMTEGGETWLGEFDPETMRELRRRPIPYGLTPLRISTGGGRAVVTFQEGFGIWEAGRNEGEFVLIQGRTVDAAVDESARIWILSDVAAPPGTACTYSISAGRFPIFNRNDAVLYEWLGKGFAERARLGGDCYDMPIALAPDGAGGLWITGMTQSNPFPTVLPIETSPGDGQSRAFAARYDTKLGTVTISTFLTLLSYPRMAGTWVAGSSTDPATYCAVIGLACDRLVALREFELAAKPANIAAISRVERIFDSKIGPYSRGAWVRIWNPGVDRATAKVLIDGVPQPIVGGGSGYVEASLTGIGLVGALLTLERDGVRSQDVVLRGSLVDIEIFRVLGEDGLENSNFNPARSGNLMSYILLGGGDLNSDIRICAGACVAIESIEADVTLPIGLRVVRARLPLLQGPREVQQIPIRFGNEGQVAAARLLWISVGE